MPAMASAALPLFGLCFVIAGTRGIERVLATSAALGQRTAAVAAITRTRGRLSAVVLALVAAMHGREARADVDRSFVTHGHVGVVSNYVSRGLTQTWGRPAAQAEIEIEHDDGFYAGTFLSNINRNQFPGDVEIDLWAGYERELGDDFAVSIEGYGYLYPGANYSHGSCAPSGACASQSFNTFQGRVGASWRWLSTKIGYAFTNYFGDSPQTGFQSDTKGTWYWEAEADYPLPVDESWHVAGHLGYTRYSAQYAYPNPAVVQDPSYWDWRVGATKSFRNALGSLRIGAFYSEASNRAFYGDVPSLTGSGTRDLGGAAFVVEIRQTF
jgi:uncharacterized protein (TIGR02001 family)